MNKWDPNKIRVLRDYYEVAPEFDEAFKYLFKKVDELEKDLFEANKKIVELEDYTGMNII